MYIKLVFLVNCDRFHPRTAFTGRREATTRLKKIMTSHPLRSRGVVSMKEPGQTSRRWEIWVQAKSLLCSD